MIKAYQNQINTLRLDKSLFIQSYSYDMETDDDLDLIIHEIEIGSSLGVVPNSHIDREANSPI